MRMFVERRIERHRARDRVGFRRRVGVDMDMRHAVGVAMPMSMAHFFSVIVAMAMAIWTVAVPMPVMVMTAVAVMMMLVTTMFETQLHQPRDDGPPPEQDQRDTGNRIDHAAEPLRRRYANQPNCETDGERRQNMAHPRPCGSPCGFGLRPTVLASEQTYRDPMIGDCRVQNADDDDGNDQHQRRWRLQVSEREHHLNRNGSRARRGSRGGPASIDFAWHPSFCTHLL